jgi:putative flippase GtrA
MARALVGRGWRYTLVGLVCAAANYIIMLAVDFLGGHYMLGTVVSFLIVTPSAYLMHSQFTFAEPLSWKAFTRFVAAVATTYPIAVFMLMILCSGLGLSVAVATPIAIVTLFAWNFVAAHWAILPRLVFTPNRSS